MKTIIACPACDCTSFDPFLVCTDFTTSGETFALQKCTLCSLVLTNPRPDDIDLAKYYESEKYISHTGKSYAIFDSLYLFARRFTLRWKTRIVARSKSAISILDYGCGTGEFLEACQALGWNCTGVEPSAIAKSRAARNVNIKASLSELEGKKFDVITLWHVLEHVPDLREKLAELRDSLSENGMLFVAVPNYAAHDAEVYREYWAAFDVPRHLWHFSRPAMQQLLTRSALTLKEIKPMKLDAFYVSLLSQKFQSGWHSPLGIARALITASISNQRAGKTGDYSSLIYIATR